MFGSGTGGKWMATTMAQEGIWTAVVERRYIGGACVNIACLPSKNVIHTAKVASLVRWHQEFGPRFLGGAALAFVDLGLDLLVLGFEADRRKLVSGNRLFCVAFRLYEQYSGIVKSL